MTMVIITAPEKVTKTTSEAASKEAGKGVFMTTLLSALLNTFFAMLVKDFPFLVVV
jgi:hypothetical protein